MKKLYFRYGAMTSGKSMNLIGVAENYRVQGKKCLVFNANIDSDKSIYSRSGIQLECDSINEINNIDPYLSCILIDECHFLQIEEVDFLRSVTILKRIPVICYGLRTNFEGNLFPASHRLLEIADSIEEVKTTCWYCERKATMNLRLYNSKDIILKEKPGEQKYVPSCFKCWDEKR